MKITVFGATGGIGRELLRQGIACGHEVTAVVRDPAGIPEELRGRVEVVHADVMNPAAIAAAVRDRDAVLTSMGTREGRTPTTVCSDSVSSIAAAMDGGRSRRLLMVSAGGLVADAGDGPLFRYALKPVLQRVLKHSYADLAEAERRIRATGLDWTIVRPSRLTNGPRTGRYRTACDLSLRRGRTTSRADVADCLLTLAADPSSVRHAVSVAY
jgi:putative NADH-flavin reductase